MKLLYILLLTPLIGFGQPEILEGKTTDSKATNLPVELTLSNNKVTISPGYVVGKVNHDSTAIKFNGNTYTINPDTVGITHGGGPNIYPREIYFRDKQTGEIIGLTKYISELEQRIKELEK